GPPRPRGRRGYWRGDLAPGDHARRSRAGCRARPRRRARDPGGLARARRGWPRRRAPVAARGRRVGRVYRLHEGGPLTMARPPLAGPPLRLRDVRRLAAQHVDVGRWSISIGRPSASRAFSRGVLEEVLGATDTAAAVLAALDRAITRYGPDADFGELLQGQRPRQQGEARPKDTAEVAEGSAQDDGGLHGGDGASGEVADSTPAGGPVGGGGTDGDSTSSGAGAPRHEASAAPADDEPATTADAGAPGA